MAVITNNDLKIMVDVEDLLHKKLVETNGIKDTFKGKEYYYFDENDKEYAIWEAYWNMVERFINDKEKANKNSATYNKRNAEYHRLANNLYNARKKNNIEKIAFYENKLKELKGE